MTFIGTYSIHSIDDQGRWKVEVVKISLIASSVEEAMEIDSQFWSFHREPANFFDNEGNPMVLTQRDNDVIEMIAKFGKTYLTILEQTYFNDTSAQYTRNRVINKLSKKFGLLDIEATGIASPRSYITLSREGKKYALEAIGVEEKDFGQVVFSLATFERENMAQIIYYSLQRHNHRVVRNSKLADLMIIDMNALLIVELHVGNEDKYAKQFKKFEDDDKDIIIYAVKDRLAAINLIGVVPASTLNMKVIIIDELTDGALEFYTIEQLKKATET